MDLKINKDFRIVDINSVIQDPENARNHTEKDIAEKKAALKQFGFTRPILVNSETNIIAGGNGFHQAAMELGFTEIPAIFIPMSAVRAKALGISDNRIGDSADYNLEQFNINISEINEWDDIDWKALAFGKDEIDLLLASLNTEITDNSEPPQETQEEPLSEEDMPAKSVKVTVAQRELFEQACKKIRTQENDSRISEGRILEMITAEYLSGI